MNKEFKNWLLSNTKPVLGTEHFSMVHMVGVVVYDIDSLESTNTSRIIDEEQYNKIKKDFDLYDRMISTNFKT